MAGVGPDLLAAYEAQCGLVADWLAGLSDADLARPSSLPGWRVAELAVHLAHVSTACAEALASPRPPRGTRALTIAQYVAHWPAAAAEIAAREITAAQGRSADDVRALFAAEQARALAELARLGGTDPVVAARRGPIRASGMLRTRVNELVVHSYDAGLALDRSAVKVSVRMLAEVLAERHPGRSVEVRVPPYAAVQIGDGPTHTRGTPPNVVECAPATFVAVVTGRRAWADALGAGEIVASGTRATLEPYVPLL